MDNLFALLSPVAHAGAAAGLGGAAAATGVLGLAFRPRLLLGFRRAAVGTPRAFRTLRARPRLTVRRAACI